MQEKDIGNQPIQPFDITPNYTTHHSHNGSDSPRIKIQDIQGIKNMIPMIGVADATIAPTIIPQYSPFVVLYDNTHWRVWIYVNSLWKSAVFS